jgi:histidinol-phosphate phosphatase family protein
MTGVQDAIKKLSTLFGRIIIVSNQQGVGKGLMTNEDVESVHEHIMESIVKVGGKIDNIYFAPQLKSANSEFRKPNIGMALLAQKDFPDINFSKSIMVGDSMSDMEFGKKAGMKTVFILNGKPVPSNTELIDACCENLIGFVSLL